MLETSKKKESNLTMMDVSCVVAAVLFFLSTLLSTIIRSNRKGFDFQLWRSMDTDYIQAEWKRVHDQKHLLRAGGTINALAWMFLAIPILQMTWILSRGGKRKIGIHLVVTILTLAGTFTELISWLFLIGEVNTAVWITEEFNLDRWIDDENVDGIGWKTLELVHIVTRGFRFWIDAFEWLALFGILTFTFISVKTLTHKPFGYKWASFGLFIALMSLIDFAADVLRLKSFTTFNKMAAVTSAINGLVLLPIWLVLLSKQLPNAKPTYNEGEEDDFVNKPLVSSARDAVQTTGDVI